MHRLFGLLAATSWRENSMIVSLEMGTSLSRKRGPQKKNKQKQNEKNANRKNLKDPPLPHTPPPKKAKKKLKNRLLVVCSPSVTPQSAKKCRFHSDFSAPSIMKVLF
jgi:hypothetical protein